MTDNSRPQKLLEAVRNHITKTVSPAGEYWIPSLLNNGNGMQVLRLCKYKANGFLMCTYESAIDNQDLYGHTHILQWVSELLGETPEEEQDTTVELKLCIDDTNVWCAVDVEQDIEVLIDKYVKPMLGRLLIAHNQQKTQTTKPGSTDVQ